MEEVKGTYDVLIAADADDPKVVWIHVHPLMRQADGLVGPGSEILRWAREANASEHLLAQGDHWFRVGREAGISDMLDVPAELRRFAQIAYEWARHKN